MSDTVESKQSSKDPHSDFSAECSSSTDEGKRSLPESESHSVDSKRQCIEHERTAALHNEALDQSCGSGVITESSGASSEDQVVSRALSSPKPVAIQTQSRPTTSCGRSIIDAGITEEEINEIINGLGEDIDSMLDERAEKNKLTAKNVKSILRHVISNKYVLAMVRNTMRSEGDEECELEEAVFEPKLTRSKAKELREMQAVLPWPVSTPVKQKEPLSNKLLSEEFSDNEGSSDEEYKPNDEELHSAEEDNNGSTKEKSKRTDSESGTDFPCLVIAEPENNLDKSSTEDDQIALRTRSKLPLTDTSLETIEASFVAPDITIDMYDTVIDDEEWQNFLRDLNHPLDVKAAEEQADDDGDDPEYNVMEDEREEEHEDEEHESEDHESEDHDEEQAKSDVPYDVVTREEMNALMSEIIHCAVQELGELEEEEHEQPNNLTYIDHTLTVAEVIPCVVYAKTNSWFNPHELLQLEQQMRMHVQLLCQSFLLSFRNEKFSDMTENSVAFLEELKMFATHSQQTALGNISSFYACNLGEALDILNKFRTAPQSSENDVPGPLKEKKGLPAHVKEVMAHSKVFIYPDLLPKVPYCMHSSKKSSKSNFTRAEDTLIAMGLEQFTYTGKPIFYIHSLLVPTKTEQQIRHRIKNVRSKDTAMDNPITRYLKYEEFPKTSRFVRPFNPLCIIPPCDMPLDALPPWMAPYVTKTSFPALAPQPFVLAPVEKILNVTGAVPKVLECKQPERRKYPPILPRGYVSPLKKISPILRKYHRRIIQMPSLCVAAPAKPATVIRKQNQRVLRPKEPVKEPSILPRNPVQVQSKGKPLAVVNPIMATQPAQVLNPAKDSTDRIVSSKTIPVVCEESKEPVKDSNPASVSDTPIKSKSEKEEIDSNDVTDSAEADVDDEQDLAALMAASSTICRRSSAAKKKNKQQRDLESSLALLSPSLMKSDPKKEERDKHFAQMYLMRVLDTLKNQPDQCEKFLELLCTFENSNKTTVQLYTEISEILKDHPILVDDFAGFLLPEQARDCGKYIQNKTLCKIREFLRKIEVHFANQPHHVQRILRAFTQLRQQKDLTSSAVMAALQPLLKNQSHLIEELMQLLPDGPPPECLMMESDFEEIHIPNSDGENSTDSFEEIVIPEAKDPYGGKDCPCNCHTSVTDVRMANRSRHCSKCGTKFIDGRIYIQTGKVLKPAHVTYHEPVVMLKSSKEGKADNSQNIPQSPSDINVSSKPRPMQSGTESSGVSKKCTSSSVESSRAQKSLLKAASENLGIESCLSSVPCYVEDAVLLPDSGNKDIDIPSDFSCLSKVILAKGTSQVSKNTIQVAAASNVPPGVIKKISVDALGSGLQKSSVNKSVKSQTHDESSPSAATLSPRKWTKEEDKLVLETCEKHGINIEAFTVAATAISTKTIQQVQARFFELMEIAKIQMKSANR